MSRHPDHLYSQKELAKIIGTSRATIDRMVRAGIDLDDICEVDWWLRHRTRAGLSLFESRRQRGKPFGTMGEFDPWPE
jgi:hypothetical protein